MFWGGVKGGHNFLSLFHVLDNFKNKIFEKKFGMTKIDRHFLLLYGVICFTLYTREIARNHLLYFLACKCVIYFRMTYLFIRTISVLQENHGTDSGYCFPYEVSFKPGIGRVLVTTRHIKPMELILVDPGTCTGPNYTTTQMVCLECTRTGEIDK